MRYFQIDGWKATGALFLFGGESRATNPPSGQGFDGPEFIVYQSELDSGEINFIMPASSWLNVSAGFRWVELDEILQQTFFSTGPSGTVIFNVDTDNHLYGFQMGADGLLVSRGSLDVNIFGKAGIYANVAEL